MCVQHDTLLWPVRLVIRWVRPNVPWGGPAPNSSWEPDGPNITCEHLNTPPPTIRRDAPNMFTLPRDAQENGTTSCSFSCGSHSTLFTPTQDAKCFICIVGSWVAKPSKVLVPKSRKFAPRKFSRSRSGTPDLLPSPRNRDS